MKKHLLLLLAILFLTLVQLLDRRIAVKLQPEESGAGALSALEPGEFIGTVALGGFRMIAVNLLWIRALDNQEQGNAFSALADAELITKLQPNLPEVWSFLAWNLAYNISAQEDDEQEGWEWVRSGIKTLRRGVVRARASPNISKVHNDLGWLYYHRVNPRFPTYYQNFLDDRELNPEGRNPVLWAVAEFETASALKDNVVTDFQLYRALLDCIEGLPLERPQRLDFYRRIEEIRDHIQAEHGDPFVYQRIAIYEQRYQAVRRRNP